MPEPAQLLLRHSAFIPHFSLLMSLHAPIPLQADVVIHVVVAFVSSVPEAMSLHVPMALQALQVPVHALSQQTPSAQKLLVQSAPIEHMSPSHFLQNEPPQSVPVSSPFFMPSLHEMHLFMMHFALVPEQSASSTHSTHIPLASHTPPGHIVPAGRGGNIGVPFEHV